MKRASVLAVLVTALAVGLSPSMIQAQGGGAPAPTPSPAPNPAAAPSPAPTPNPAAAPSPAPGPPSRAAGSPPTAPPAAQAQGPAPVTRSVHGSWKVQCAGAAKGSTCVLIQSAPLREGANAGITVLVIKTPKAPFWLRMVTPLGVLVPAGLEIRIDGVKIGRAEYVRCEKAGCIAQVALEKVLLDKLQKGKEVTMVIHQNTDAEIPVQLSLKGLADGYRALSRF